MDELVWKILSRYQTFAENILIVSLVLLSSLISRRYKKEHIFSWGTLPTSCRDGLVVLKLPYHTSYEHATY